MDALAPAREVRANLGRFGSEAEALDGLVRRLVEDLDPAAVWLFGSRARGDARPDSDFDFLVVAKPNGSFGSDDYEKVYAPTSGSGVGCDVVPCSTEDFVEGATLRTSLVARILAEGKQVYLAGETH